MNQNFYMRAVGSIFSLIALLHLLRISYGWEAVIGGFIVPLWLSWVALVITAYLAYCSFRFSR